MGTQVRRKRASVKDNLFENTYEFDFYQAVNLLQRIFPDKIKDINIEQRSLFFNARIRMDFPSSDLEEIVISDDKEQSIALLTNFLSLAGVTGPLPYFYTELIIKRLSQKDDAFKDFLDIFNHRLITLLFDLKRKYSVVFGFRNSIESQFAGYLSSFIGIGMKNLSGRLAVSDRALLYYTGILLHQKRSMVGLRDILAHYFQAPVEMKQFQGAWFKLEPDQYTRIGSCGQNRVLGDNAVLGKKVWLQDKKIRIVIGPVPYEKYISFLPIGSACKELTDLVRFYTNDQFEFDFELIPERKTVPACELSGKKHLGWTTILPGKKEVRCVPG